jgi:hypothetical protein
MEWILNKKCSTFFRYNEDEQVKVYGKPEKGDTIVLSDKHSYIYNIDKPGASNATSLTDILMEFNATSYYDSVAATLMANLHRSNYNDLQMSSDTISVDSASTSLPSNIWMSTEEGYQQALRAQQDGSNNEG